MEHIAVKNCQYAKRIWKEFRIENVGQYHNLYLSDSLTNVFETFPNKCIEIYKLNPVFFFFSNPINTTSSIKKVKMEVEPLTELICY